MSQTLQVALPDSLRVWVEGQAAANGYGSVAQYIEELLRKEQALATERRVCAGLVEADSEPGIEMTLEDWWQIRQKARERARRAC